jgi:uncharacterized membrane protein
MEEPLVTAQTASDGLQQHRPASNRAAWLATLRRFLIFIAAGNLAWEVAQLPLYTIWYDGTPGQIAFAVAHCTGGDILIAGASLLLALMIAARPGWPDETYRRVAALTLAFAVPYTVFSEWLNTEVRGSWAYSQLLPVVPVLDAGLAPLAQWIVIPIAAFWWARRPARKASRVRSGDDIAEASLLRGRHRT